MPKISINILTKNRKDLLLKAIESVLTQSMKDFEIVVVNDGSTDGTLEQLKALQFKDLKIIHHQESLGITQSRQEALEASVGEYIAILDDDDRWIDLDKLKKQAEFLDKNPEYILVGGSMQIRNKKLKIIKRPQSYNSIKNWMLLKNPFFTSTVMFKKSAALKAGGFIKDEIDFAEDYDLWLRIGRLGKMYNFLEPFTLYAKTQYNKEKFTLFLKKQQRLINLQKNYYPNFWLANLILKIRQFF